MRKKPRQRKNSSRTASPRNTRWREAGTGFILGWLLGLGALQLIREVVPLIGSDLLMPVSAVIGALLAQTRLRGALWICGGAIVAGLVVVSYTPMVAHLIPDVMRSDPPRPSPAVVVLAATIQKDGELGAASQVRLLQGYKVMRDGLARRLVLTRLPPPQGSYAPVVRRQMEMMGLDLPIDETGPIRNTHDEAVEVARLARRRGWRHVILVTHPWHMRRAAAVFEKAGLQVVCSPCVEGNYDLDNLDSPSARLLAFRDWAHEAIGYQVYRWRGWL